MFIIRTIGLQNIRYVKTKGWFITRIPVKGDLPKNIKWVKELSPSLDLLMKYKNKEISYNEFKIELDKERKLEVWKNKMEELLEVIKEIIKNEKIKEKELYLICYETKANKCHRSIVAEEIKDMALKEGIDIYIHHMG